jgi:hypothetical protein
MQFNIPKDNDKYQWTAHSVMKMRQYGLSAQRVLRVVRAPHRKEEGIVKKTVAVMQPVSFKTDKEGKRTWGSEIWVMYQLKRIKNKKSGIKNDSLNKKLDNIFNSQLSNLNSANQKIRIISAWKYPGVSPKNNPVPEDILRELEDIV